MNSLMGRSKSAGSQKRMSRLVRMPIRRPSWSTMGTPLNRNRCISDSASCSSAVAGRVTGSVIMPLWLRFTRCTSAACTSMGRLRWITPMPPTRAMAMAIGASVTLSMAADTRGTASSMSPAKRAVVSTGSGRTLRYPGTMTTSSNVSASKRSKRRSLCWLVVMRWAPRGWRAGCGRDGRGCRRADGARRRGPAR